MAGIFHWLFGTREGVICLIVGGMLLFLVIAIVIERRTREAYDDYDEEGDEDGWSVFDDDNK